MLSVCASSSILRDGLSGLLRMKFAIVESEIHFILRSRLNLDWAASRRMGAVCKGGTP